MATRKERDGQRARPTASALRAKRAPAQKRVWYWPPIAFERLQAMIATLESGDKLTREIRSEIADALDCLFVTQIIEERLATPGQPPSSLLLVAGYMVHELVEKHGALVKTAAAAVLPGANQRAVNALKRQYSKQKRGPGFKGISVREDLMARAVAWLGARPKKGNK